MTSCGHIALSLVALHAVAIFMFWRKRRKYEANGSQLAEDVISQLPDDNLISIISCMPLKAGTRTSLLSKRWRNLHKLVTDINNLSCDDLLLRREHTRPYHHEEDSRQMVSRLCYSLSHYHRIRSLKLNCCINLSYLVKKCLYHLPEAETLSLCFSCCEDPTPLPFLINYLGSLRSLKLLRLRSCVLMFEPSCQFYSLRTLHLNTVKLGYASLDCVFSTCLRLHSLSITQCDCPAKITISGPHLPLKSLVMDYCRGIEAIQFSAPNLTVFDFKNDEMVSLKFDHIPQLETLNFMVQGNNSMSLVFGELADYLCSLKSLSLATRGELYQPQPQRRFGFHTTSQPQRRFGFYTFSELRQLELFVCCTSRINLLSLPRILQRCPLLQEFGLDLQNLDYEEGSELRKWSRLHHMELKKVEISGFSGKQNEIDFALCTLRGAESLEQMRLIWRAKYDTKCCMWITKRREKWSDEIHQMILQQLQGQALSVNAHLIIQP